MEDVEIERSDDNEPKRAKYAIQVILLKWIKFFKNLF